MDMDDVEFVPAQAFQMSEHANCVALGCKALSKDRFWRRLVDSPICGWLTEDTADDRDSHVQTAFGRIAANREWTGPTRARQVTTYPTT